MILLRFYHLKFNSKLFSIEILIFFIFTDILLVFMHLKWQYIRCIENLHSIRIINERNKVKKMLILNQVHRINFKREKKGKKCVSCQRAHITINERNEFYCETASMQCKWWNGRFLFYIGTASTIQIRKLYNILLMHCITKSHMKRNQMKTKKDFFFFNLIFDYIFLFRNSIFLLLPFFCCFLMDKNRLYIMLGNFLSILSITIHLYVWDALWTISNKK